MNELISQILALYEHSGQSLQSVLLSVLSNYNFSKKKDELCTSDSSWQQIVYAYLKKLYIHGLSQGTLSNYKCLLTNMFRVVGKPVDKVTSEDFEAYLAYKKNVGGCGPNYLEDIRRVINKFYNWCWKERYINYNPLDLIDHIRVPKKKVHSYSECELERMRISCDQTRYPIRNRAIVELLDSSGIRAHELLSLNIGDIDLNMCTGLVRKGKGAKERKIRFSKVAAYYIQQYLNGRNSLKSSDPLFISHTGSRFADSTSVGCLIKSIAKIGGVEDAKPHRFRHTFITRCINRGMRIEDVQNLVGHENIETTKIYYDENIQKADEAYNRICN